MSFMINFDDGVRKINNISEIQDIVMVFHAPRVLFHQWTDCLYL